MKAKRLYIAPAMRPHKLKFKTSILQSSNVEIDDDGKENIDVAKRSNSFTYDDFGAKSDNSSSDLWK